MITNSEFERLEPRRRKGEAEGVVARELLPEQGDGDARLLEDGPENHRRDEEHEDGGEALAVDVAAHGEPDDGGHRNDDEGCAQPVEARIVRQAP